MSSSRSRRWPPLARAQGILSLVCLVGCREALGVDEKDFGETPPQATPDAGDGGGSGGAGGVGGAVFVLDTLNAQAASQEFFFAERTPELIASLGASPADVVCLQEISRGAEKAALLEALAGEYPYAASFPTDSSMPVDSPTDSSGEVPAELPPPCVGLEGELDSFLACAKASCSTLPGSEDGVLTSESCFLEQCGAELQMALGTFERKACARCVRQVAPTLTLSAIRERCTTVPGMPFFMGGDNDTAIVSRHPIVASGRWILPSTNTVRVVLFARVEKPGLAPLDVYCTRLDTIHDGAFDVYYGLYGEGNHGQKGWEAEQRLQVQKIIDFMSGLSRERPGLLAGWMGTSRLVKEGTTLVVEEVAPQTLAALDALLVSASTAEEDRVCTACRDNALYDDSLFDRRVDHVYLRGLQREDVVSLSRVYDEPIVQVTPNAASKGRDHVPLSDNYGLRLTLRAAPAGSL
jgi:hypothetical protein